MTAIQQNKRCDSRGILKNGMYTRTTQQRKVLFHPQAEVYPIPALNEYTEAEICGIWFQDFEYKQIKANDKIMTRMKRNGGCLEDDSFCFRGLEFKTMAGSQRRRRCTTTAALAVFSEQQRQRRQYDLGKTQFNFERIGEVYAYLTAEAQARAHEMGLQDASIIGRGAENDGDHNLTQKVALFKACPDDNSTLTADTGHHSQSSGTKSTDAIAESHRNNEHRCLSKSPKGRRGGYFVFPFL
jgi:hypothetical protein